MALRDIPTCFITCQKSLCVTGAIFQHRFQKMSSAFRGRGNALETSIFILRDRGSTLDMSCCVSFSYRNGRAASSRVNVQLPWQAWRFVRCVENWQKPCTKHRF